MTSTLTDLERRLVELERELSSVAGAAAMPAPAPVVPPPAPRAAPPPPPAAPPPAVDPRERLESMRAQVDELMRFREQLEATARDLVAEYDRVVTKVTEPAVVEAGPFEGIGAVARFEEQLRALPGVHEAKVRRYKGGHAVIDVQLESEG